MPKAMAVKARCGEGDSGAEACRTAVSDFPNGSPSSAYDVTVTAHYRSQLWNGSSKGTAVVSLGLC